MMTPELNDRIARIVSRAAIHATSALEKVSYAGAKMKTRPEWGRHDEARRELETAQAELRTALGLVGCAVEWLDGETRTPKEAA